MKKFLTWVTSITIIATIVSLTYSVIKELKKETKDDFEEDDFIEDDFEEEDFIEDDLLD